ncbi:MAG TPA: PhzF family phenazine biosynthesis protein, partial [Candidatus Acidoferrales bacterium]|nr:PhzF family phenazine biosynthesis protein [Candidatus Acidoferrales bacterium]
LVDVFAETKYAGNQLAVIPNATDLTTLQMQQIANETHFSETTLITSNQPHNGGYDVRIFTPKQEVPFAGHPTLGTAYIIKQYIAEGNPDTVTLNLGVGQIPVSFQKNYAGQEVLWMRQKPPVFQEKFSIEELAAILQLSPSDFDGRFPIQEVSTGMPFMIVPLKTLDAIKRARVDLTKLQKIADRVHGGILTFCPQTYNPENNLNVRVFVDLFGIPEDPATGSGNGCLAAYLSKYQYFGSDKVDARVEQGFEINRPSLLLLKAHAAGEDIAVSVGGKVVLVGLGTLV